MRRLNIFFFLAFVFSMQTSEAYRILCYFPFQGKSHFVIFEALCKGLAKRGHEIDMISHFPLKEPPSNYTDIIDLTGTLPKIVNNFTIEYGKIMDAAVIYHIATVYGYDVCNNVMASEKIQKFVKNPPNDPPYDLLITEMFGSSCNLAFGTLLNVPVVGVVTNIDMHAVSDAMGNPMSYSSWAGIHLRKATVDTFFDRLWNFLINYRSLQQYYYYTSDQTELIRKYLRPDLPDVRELEKNMSLVLINGHHSFYKVRPMAPAIIEVAGLHIEEAPESKLSPELQAWMDSAESGVVYFSLGSMLNIETLPKETILGLYASFAKIAPVKVLMKSAYASTLPPGLPKNVITLSWIPQMAVLAHKNTRVFITHGGLMGAQETLYHGVPLIGIPVFGDQQKNVRLAVHNNMGYLLDVDNLNEQTMDAALNAVLRDPKYAESAKKMSKLFRDRPMSPMNTAAYWIEYVIRNGPDTLKSPARNQPWWKRSLVDVFAFLAGCIIIAIGLLVALVKMLLKTIRGSKAPLKKKLK